MKKILLILILILIGCSEPDPINIDKLNFRNEKYYMVNSLEPYSGEVFNVYPNGQYQQLGNLKEGKFDGYRKSFHINGQLESEEIYEKGKLNGVSKYFSKNGKLYEEGNYIDGLKDGNYMLYHENGKISQEIVYSYGRKNGEINQFDLDGKQILEGRYSNDEKTGTWIWYENGEFSYEEVFKTEDDLRITKSELNNFYIFDSEEFIPLEGLITHPMTIRFKSYRENYINIYDNYNDREFFIFYKSIKNNSNTSFSENWNTKEKYFLFSNTTSLELILFSESYFLDISTDIINDSPVELFFSKEPFGITIKKYVSKN